MRRRLRRLAIALLGVCTVMLASVLIAGELLSHPAQGSVGPPPLDLRAMTISLRTARGEAVAGWMSPGRPGAGVVLLLHGVRADRRQMLDRARFLHRAGHAVLLIDLPAHGESAGAHITFGLAEAEGVTAALAYLAATLPTEKIAVIGVSLGAASLVLSKPVVPLSAVVLESMYPTIRDAVSDRLDIYLGPAGRWLAPALLWQLPLRLGISADQLRPIVDLARLNAPVLIATGSEDRNTTLVETQRIFAAAQEPKALWIVKGAAHVDLYEAEPVAYESKISAFLARYLNGSSGRDR